MKAMILAAGLGTRLAPHTDTLPKPLFPIAKSVMIDRLIRQLVTAGATQIMINTHHLHQKIEAYIRSQTYPIKVRIRFEPQILGTGGALKNISDFWQKGPLLVINGDIVTNIDLGRAYQFHLNHPDPVTMVMHDYPAFNGVSVNFEGFITEFGRVGEPSKNPQERKLAYTGIQIIDHSLLKMIPPDTFCSIIDIYKTFLSQNGKIAAFMVENHYWHDMGTPQGLRNAALEQLIQKVFKRREIESCDTSYKETHLAGDGSDRKWSRLRTSSNSVILADHGIVGSEKRSETGSFIRIGQHLAAKKIPVPTIYAADEFSGLVLLEDLGDVHLHTLVTTTKDRNKIVMLYRQVIDRLILLSMTGYQNFDPKWAFQTQYYDQTLILEKECRYFMEAFINGVMEMKASYRDLKREFEMLADMTIEHAVTGLIHRDCQSRNIMWYNNQSYFIDFQGARIGPIQYDLASLLIDPYVSLDQNIQDQLLDYYDQKIAAEAPKWRGKWQMGYACCRLTRNLQILGAFGYLSRVKGKSFFAGFIPKAVETLKNSLNTQKIADLDRLTELVNQISCDSV
jgi:NDP-sugar pyrophosphorylase family protein/tRNA A-37 threonylcarbamoyl transferase component Bud32